MTTDTATSAQKICYMLGYVDKKTSKGDSSSLCSWPDLLAECKVEKSNATCLDCLETMVRILRESVSHAVQCKVENCSECDAWFDGLRDMDLLVCHDCTKSDSGCLCE